jgi:hypothetical protein
VYATPSPEKTKGSDKTGQTCAGAGVKSPGDDDMMDFLLDDDNF